MSRTSKLSSSCGTAETGRSTYMELSKYSQYAASRARRKLREISPKEPVAAGPCSAAAPAKLRCDGRSVIGSVGQFTG